MCSKVMVSAKQRRGRYKDYVCELNKLRGPISTSRAVAKLNRWIHTGAASVLRGHPTLIRVHGVARRILVRLLLRLLDPRGSAVIVRRRGEAAAWLLRPLANQTIIKV